MPGADHPSQNESGEIRLAARGNPGTPGRFGTSSAAVSSIRSRSPAFTTTADPDSRRRLTPHDITRDPFDDVLASSAEGNSPADPRQYKTLVPSSRSTTTATVRSAFGRAPWVARSAPDRRLGQLLDLVDGLHAQMWVTISTAAKATVATRPRMAVLTTRMRSIPDGSGSISRRAVTVPVEATHRLLRHCCTPAGCVLPNWTPRVTSHHRTVLHSYKAKVNYQTKEADIP